MSTTEIAKFAEKVAFEIATEDNGYAAGVNEDDVAEQVAEIVESEFGVGFDTAFEIGSEAATIVDVIQNS